MSSADYLGEPPAEMTLSLSGGRFPILSPHPLGSHLVFTIEAVVKSAAHTNVDGRIQYAERLTIVDIVEEPVHLLDELRSVQRRDDYATSGEFPLPGIDPGLFAWIHFEDQPGDAELDESSSYLWPKDFPPGSTRPKVGDNYLTHHGERIVGRVSSFETGEDLTDPDPTAEPDEPGDPFGDDDYSGEDYSATTPDPAFSAELGSELAPWPTTPAPADPDTPTTEDFGTMALPIRSVKESIDRIENPAMLRRMRAAEEQGRGTNLRPRRAIIDRITARLAALEITEQLAESADTF